MLEGFKQSVANAILGDASAQRIDALLEQYVSAVDDEDISRPLLVVVDACLSNNRKRAARHWLEVLTAKATADYLLPTAMLAFRAGHADIALELRDKLRNQIVMPSDALLFAEEATALAVRLRSVYLQTQTWHMHLELLELAAALLQPALLALIGKPRLDAQALLSRINRLRKQMSPA